MNCRRCHGLMVTIRLEDAESSTRCYSGWQCLMCGEVVDSGIKANRRGHQEPRRDQTRRRYGIALAESCRPKPKATSI
jgi:hypothetical protein